MRTFLVERDIPGTEMAGFLLIASAAHGMADTMRRDGLQIYYLGSTFLPEDGRCLCLFEADGTGLIEQLNRNARLAFNTIRRAVSIFSPAVTDVR